MARSFSGSSDRVLFSSGATTSFPYGSFVFLVKAGTGPSIRVLMVTGSANYQSIYLTSSGVVTFQGPASCAAPTIRLLTSEGFVLLGLTKASGSNPVRFHKYDYATDTFTHEDSSSSSGDVSGILSNISLGNEGSGAQFGGDVAAAAIWSGVVLGDAQFEQMAFSLQQWIALTPSALWVLDQSATTQNVRDWTGNGANQTSVSGTSVAAASVPVLSYGHPVIAPTRTAAPPWLNQNSGVAARNGTSSHTIPLGFTSTSGNELVVIVYGGVTHTASGWTEQLSPVSSGELSVFTKTSAGDSDITVVHNGSNYPVDWVAYELPAGSTYTAGTSSSPTSDTFPALSGLPGTAQLVIAARGRIAGSTAATATSTVWDSPLTEDADLFVAHDGSTDGAYLTVGHTVGYTGTSITPTATTTIGGTWVVSDRQHAIFAIALGGGGGPVTHNADATLAVTGAISAVGAKATSASASLAATATIATAVTAARAANSSLAVTAGIAATATPARLGQASLTATAAIIAATDVNRAGSANLTATVTIAASAESSRLTGGSLAVTATTSAVAVSEKPASASLAAAATISASTAKAASLGASLAAAATITAAAGRDAQASATVSAAVTISAAGSLAGAGATADLAVTATLGAAASRTAVGQASLAAVAAINAATAQMAAASIAVNATLSATGVAERAAQASLAITAGIAASTAKAIGVATTLPVSAAISATGNVAGTGANADLPVAVAIGASATRTASALTTLTVVSTISSAGATGKPATASLNVSTTTTAAATSDTGASLAATVTISAAGARIAVATSDLVVVASLTAGSSRLVITGATLAAVVAFVAAATTTGPVVYYRPGILTPGSTRSAPRAGTLPYPRLTAGTRRGPTYGGGG